MGTQTCAADGKSWSPCDCGGGSAGSSASGSSAGGSGQASSSGAGGMTASSSGAGGMTASSSGAGGMTAVSSSSGTGGNPADCDPTEPNSGDMCGPPVVGCVYGDQHCECWQLGGGGPAWDCDTCPMAEPTDGDACMSGGGTTRCWYGATQCACTGGNWSCHTCPGTEPMNMDPCTELGLHCIYPGANCSCFAAGGGMPAWFCF